VVNDISSSHPTSQCRGTPRATRDDGRREGRRDGWEYEEIGLIKAKERKRGEGSTEVRERDKEKKGEQRE